MPGYNENVPMTDPSLPGKQIKAKWRSGFPTLATSGGSFVNGEKWGALDGALAVACLKASRVLFLTFNRHAQLKKVRTPKALRQYGRIRQVVQSANGDLLVHSAGEITRHKRPVAYQHINGNRKEIPAYFQKQGDTIRFAVAPYDRRHPLTIDPVLKFSSALSTAASTCGGMVWRCGIIGRGLSVTTRATTACAVLPVNGGSPVSISYSTAPSA